MCATATAAAAAAVGRLCVGYIFGSRSGLTGFGLLAGIMFALVKEVLA